MTRTNQRIFTILFIFSTFCASTSFSQDERVRREDPFDREAMLKRFDADGDGELNEAERKEMRDFIFRSLEERPGGNLSGGQQQQLAIARALVGDPKILLLDEPTEGIQPSIILEIERVLLQLKEQGKFTIVLVEQYFDFARQIADYFFLMDRGSILLQGHADELSDENIKQHLTF